MSTIDRREFVRLLALTAVQPLVDNSSAKVSGADGSAPPASADGLSIVSRHKVVTTSPPGNIPTAVSSDALFLGNGDLISAFAGDPDLLQFWVTLNDFWEMREWGGPRALGRIVFELPDFQGATYRVEQDLATATLTGIFTSGLRTLTMTSWVAATENLLVVELTVEGGSTSGRVSFRFPDELGLGVTKNQNWGLFRRREPARNAFAHSRKVVAEQRTPSGAHVPYRYHPDHTGRNGRAHSRPRGRGVSN